MENPIKEIIDNTVKKAIREYGIPPEKSVSSLSALQLCIIIIIAVAIILKKYK